MENEVRLVDANTLPIKFDGHTFSVWKCDLDAAPTIDAIPVVHGRWHDVYLVAPTIAIGTCSHCNEKSYMNSNFPYLAKYCPNCDAKMDLEEVRC